MIQKRHIFGGLFEIVFPIILSLILSWVREGQEVLVDKEYHFTEFEIKKDFDDCT